MTAPARSARRSVALGVLRTATIFCAITVLAEGICLIAVPELIVPEGAWLPALVVYAFAAGSPLVGALLLGGLAMCIGIPRPARPCAEGAAGVALFAVSLALLPRVGVFL